MYKLLKRFSIFKLNDQFEKIKENILVLSNIYFHFGKLFENFC